MAMRVQLPSHRRTGLRQHQEQGLRRFTLRGKTKVSTQMEVIRFSAQHRENRPCDAGVMARNGRDARVSPVSRA